MKMEDIARLANVSKSAVSLALNNKPGISEATRDRILKIVQETGYIHRSMVKTTPANEAAKAFNFVAFTNSGIVLEQYYKQPFFMELIHFIEEECRSRGYSLIFSSVNMDHFEEEIQEVIDKNRNAGVILLGTNLSRNQISQIADMHQKLIVLDTCYESLGVNFVVMNNVLGAYQATAHLYELGHRHIGYVQSNTRMYNFDARKKGFETALADFGLTLDEQHVFSVHPTITGYQEDFAKQWLQSMEKQQPLPTAIFCECDYSAISIIKTFAELNISVPDDVSVVGFDNISESLVITPELTTIHVEKEQMAAFAVERLIQIIEDKNVVTMKALIDTKLIERRSSRLLTQ